MSAGKFVLVDLQGAAYSLYDAEITTLKLQSAADQEKPQISRKTTNVGYFAV